MFQEKVVAVKPNSPKPTRAELDILRVLWDRGPATVREVHEILFPDRPITYTRTLKLMQNMANKNLVTREIDQRAHRYRAHVSEQEAEMGIVSDVLGRVFAGSAAKLMMRALSVTQTTPGELAEIRKMLDEAEQRSK